MNELALFSGAGGGILGGHLLGWRTVCAVEFDEYARSVLIARQEDRTLPPFPIWDDVRTFDGRPWAGVVDIVSGGFPCQDISCAGKGAGIDGERSGLWGEMFRVVRDVGPRFVFVENSPMLTSRGLGRVLGDLASFGYDAEWVVLGADDVGAPHRRERIWILAHANGLGSGARSRLPDGEREKVPDADRRSWCGSEPMADARCGRRGSPGRREVEQPRGAEAVGSGETLAHADGHAAQGMDSWAQPGGDGRPVRLHDRTGGAPGRDWWEVEPHMGRMVDGLATGLDFHGTHADLDVGRVATGVRHRVGRLRCIGNGQVPMCAATAFRVLMARIQKNSK